MINYDVSAYSEMFGEIPDFESLNIAGQCIGQCTGCMCSCRCSCSGGIFSDVEWEIF
ncbi:FibroRumin family radical SAM-modified Cys-rich RiPP [Proteus mirabilis]|uniref:FibroRumin family radical SAM-modified Cys-rich RiPP n=1 Tax=Proteus mirabilis TaxID=584 RepID=UPI000D8DB68C|nr:FibroRumin family radical SAM-modified Cys-rich RiPP [Proteus mirabilis]EJD6331303.1 FibroRumin family radical SAM-modified Cys-rich RiPP [Proteus mirabilis]EJD6391408.1 FibroRumin family radical SAM-modified Cys-rich RiPP [Proteus mirabilis]EKU5732763.1 FibroRumin family radical SAM-modified Cys-rich RiPP [Proteus mirabilis]EKU8091868.1 FibroRumin family radical SAM-modified Cys-rich RiPP [Proteus mirabilis]EKW1741811.1 FibroRumin family radical SAM-modified Cys-rich RiPP [Proteus mirabili